MRVLNKNNGFTLFEIIVGINIGFLLLTVLVSFFLFSTKFISSTTKNLNERQNINDFLIRFETTLRKADHFYIQKLDSSFVCIVNNYDSISFNKNFISLMDIYIISEIENYGVNITMESGELLSFSNGSLEESFPPMISSGDIISIDLDVLKNSHSYRAHYITPNISINRFRNIDK